MAKRPDREFLRVLHELQNSIRFAGLTTFTNRCAKCSIFVYFQAIGWQGYDRNSFSQEPLLRRCVRRVAPPDRCLRFTTELVLGKLASVKPTQHNARPARLLRSL